MGRRRTIADATLLEAARAAFVEHGMGASTRDIAKRAGVSEGVLFQRFGTKAELFFAAMAPPAFDWRRLRRTPGRTDGGQRRLVTLVHALVEYFRDAVPVLLPLMSHPDFHFEEFAARHPGSSLTKLRRELVEHLAAERAARRLGQIEPGPAALALIAIGHSVAVFERLGAHGGRFPDALVQGAVESLWQGFGTDGGAGRPPRRVRRARPGPGSLR